KPSAFPLRERKRLKAWCARKFARSIFGCVDSKRQGRRCSRQSHAADDNGGEQQEEFPHETNVCSSSMRTLRTSSSVRSSRAPQARATNPVIFATAKLIPLRFRFIGTPGNGRGYPDA